jgi:hypothetical protein
MKNIIALCFLFLTASVVLRAQYSDPCLSVEFGEVLVQCSANTNHYSQIHFFDSLSKPLLHYSAALYFEEEEPGLDFRIFLFDVNEDKKDDLLVKRTETIGAGPMAGVQEYRYSLFVQNDSNFIASRLDGAVSKYLKLQPYPNDAETVIGLYQEAFKNTLSFSIGLPIPDSLKKKLLLREDENLILSFKLAGTGKRITLATDQQNNYLSCRYAADTSVEWQYRQAEDDKSFFQYYQEDNYGYTRFFLKKLSFKTGDLEYSIYQNYSESKVYETGVGLIINNLKTGDIEIFSADKNTLKGGLQNVPHLPFISPKTVFGDDYSDE